MAQETQTKKPPESPRSTPSSPPPLPSRASSTPPAPQPAAGADEGELERVRQIILGPEHTRSRMQGAEVDRLRQVIFGAQMQEYERRFNDLRREMDRMLNDLRVVQDTVSEFEKSQTKRIETVEREMRRTNDELRREIARLTAREGMIQQLLTRTQQQEIAGQGLADRTTELSDALKQRERELTSLRNTVSENREQHDRRLDVLKREVRQAEDDLRSELRRVTDRLGDQKTDRKALAAMLMEVATRLETGSSVTGLLEGLTTAKQE